MSSKHIGGDVNYVYPTGEIAVMGPEGAVNILHKGKLSEEKRAEVVDDYRNTFASPFIKLPELGYVDEIIYPKETRIKLIQALELTQNKSKTNSSEKTREYSTVSYKV